MRERGGREEERESTSDTRRIFEILGNLVVRFFNQSKSRLKYDNRLKYIFHFNWKLFI